MTTIITITMLIFAACMLIQTICDSKRCDEYHKYYKKAQDELGLTKEDFKRYIDCAKRIYGDNKDLYLNAYDMAREEWYDLNYK